MSSTYIVSGLICSFTINYTVFSHVIFNLLVRSCYLYFIWTSWNSSSYSQK